MVKTIIAAAAFILLAGAAVVWTSTGKVEASTPPAAVKGDRLDIRPTGPDCSERAWPYYETHCLRDRSRPLGRPREVRIVALHQAIH